ncbi:MAG: hypothetical protein IPM34_08690 [Saprospiraceae bacterium]|nr:hypothetical protein [Saprospiraceae bacterium]
MKKLEKYYLTPQTLGLATMGIFICFAGVELLLEKTGIINSNPLNIWWFASSLILFYIILSSIFCFNASNRLIYYRNAILIYVMLAAAICGFSSLITGIGISEAASHSWIIYVLSIVFIVFMAIIAMIRKIVDLAHK